MYWTGYGLLATATNIYRLHFSIVDNVQGYYKSNIPLKKTNKVKPCHMLQYISTLRCGSPLLYMITGNL